MNFYNLISQFSYIPTFFYTPLADRFGLWTFMLTFYKNYMFPYESHCTNASPMHYVSSLQLTPIKVLVD